MAGRFALRSSPGVPGIGGIPARRDGLPPGLTDRTNRGGASAMPNRPGGRRRCASPRQRDRGAFRAPTGRSTWSRPVPTRTPPGAGRNLWQKVESSILQQATGGSVLPFGIPFKCCGCRTPGAEMRLQREIDPILPGFAWSGHNRTLVSAAI